jgi:hypothetical protein
MKISIKIEIFDGNEQIKLYLSLLHDYQLENQQKNTCDL